MLKSLPNEKYDVEDLESFDIQVFRFPSLSLFEFFYPYSETSSFYTITEEYLSLS